MPGGQHTWHESKASLGSGVPAFPWHVVYPVGHVSTSPASQASARKKLGWVPSPSMHWLEPSAQHVDGAAVLPQSPHWQNPAPQCSFSGQRSCAQPQSSASLAGAQEPSRHSTVSLGQRHSPLRQTAPGGQMVPQEPQLFGSLLRLKQPSGQRSVPGGQLHSPLRLRISPGGQPSCASTTRRASAAVATAPSAARKPRRDRRAAIERARMSKRRSSIAISSPIARCPGNGLAYRD